MDLPFGGSSSCLVTSLRATRLAWCASTSTPTRTAPTAPSRPAELVRRAHRAGHRRAGAHRPRHHRGLGARPPTRRPARAWPWCAASRSAARFEGSGVHLLAYLPDPTYPPLAAELRRVLDGRNSRLPATLERLRALGIDIDVHDVRRVAGETAAMGRPHVADALVALGVVADRNEAFNRYLGPQGPAYVHRYAADLEAMIGRSRRPAGSACSRTRGPPGTTTRRSTPPASRRLQAGRPGRGRGGPRGPRRGHPRPSCGRWRHGSDLVVTGSSDHHGTRQDRPRPRGATPPHPTSSSGCSPSPRTPPRLRAAARPRCSSHEPRRQRSPC